MKQGIIILFLLASVSITLAQSSFNKVRHVILDENTVLQNDKSVVEELAVYQRRELPQYEVNMKSIFQFGAGLLENAAKKTITNHADYRDRLPKLLHPNGVCVMGKWQMNESSPYTGAFSAKENLFIGRISVAMDVTTSDGKRGFGFAGKIFPTQDPNEISKTENFFSVDVLLGTKTPSFLDTALTNEPEVGFDLSLAMLGLKIATALKKGDENPGFRPVKNIASLGTAPGAKLKWPKWIRIMPATGVIKNSQKDFRSEILQASSENSELVFTIDGSDTTKDRMNKNGWTNLGKIVISEAAVSYGCDRRLHFGHPKLNE